VDTLSFSPAPTSPDEILTPEWLSWALGTPFASVEVVEVIRKIATKVRFRAIPVDGSVAPRTLCLKGLFIEVPTGRAMPSTASQAETLFYRDVVGSLCLRSPPCDYAKVDPATGNGIILMHDMVAAGGRFLEAMSPYSLTQARSSLAEMARLHATHWNGAGLDDYPWLQSRVAQIAASPLRSADELNALINDPRGDSLPAAIKRAERIDRGLRALADDARRQPECMVHGDAHAANLFERDGHVAMVDWQLVQRSSWAIDVAYHLGSALSVEDRRTHERELVSHYLDQLGGLGVEAPALDAAFDAYRKAMVYGYYMWAITRKVERPTINEFTHRLGTAVVDHESFEALGL
jgi:hypothetical protein